MIAFVNNEFVAEEHAVLRVKDLAIQRGYAIFDFFCFRDRTPLFLNDYFDRFYASAEMFYLTVPLARHALQQIIMQLIEKNGMENGGIRLQLTGGYSADGYQIAEPNFFITQHEIASIAPAQFDAGIKILTHDYQRTLPEVKSTNYLMGVWMQKKLKEENAADVVFYTNDVITEFPRANIFIVSQENTVLTPARNILKGITRSKILTMANADLVIEEADISVQDLHRAKEVFLTSSTRDILPVTQVDEQIIGDGKAGRITSMLSKKLQQLQNEYIQANH